MKWLAGMLYAAAIVAALAFGAQQALAARSTPDPCVCTHGGPPYQCDACCWPTWGFCTTADYCICA